jgi:hypothetical protein
VEQISDVLAESPASMIHRHTAGNYMETPSTHSTSSVHRRYTTDNEIMRDSDIGNVAPISQWCTGMSSTQMPTFTGLPSVRFQVQA